MILRILTVFNRRFKLIKKRRNIANYITPELLSSIYYLGMVNLAVYELDSQFPHHIYKYLVHLWGFISQYVSFPPKIELNFLKMFILETKYINARRNKTNKSNFDIQVGISRIGNSDLYNPLSTL